MEHLIPPGDNTLPIRVRRVSAPTNLTSEIPWSRDLDEKTYSSLIPGNETAAQWLLFLGANHPEQLSYFLQNTYWFGLLRGVLGEFIHIEQFTSEADEYGVRYLNTSALEECLLLWKEYISSANETSREEARGMVWWGLLSIARGLRILGLYIDTIFDETAARDSAAYNPDEDILGQSHFACVVMHQAVARAYCNIFEIPFRPGGDLSLRRCMPWLLRKAKLEGWCPYTIWHMSIISNIENLVYGYCLGSSRAEQNHTQCSINACEANAVPAEVRFEPKHMETGCHCSLIEPAAEDMMAVLTRDDIPILEIGDSMSLKVFGMRTSGHAYVALSHVWIDGLGSPQSNAITQCQLKRIHDRIGKIAIQQGCELPYVWIDTLCIPVDPELQHLRTMQIKEMYNVYKNAHAVLVMDPDFLAMTTTATPVEIGMRIFMSAWASRLWTFQEGSLNQKLFLMCKDGIIDVSRGIKEDQNQLGDSKLLSTNLEADIGAVVIWTLGRPHYDSDPAGDLDSSQGAVIAAQFYNVMDSIRKDGDTDAQKLLQAFTHRTSSRSDDEPIIIAASLGLDTTSVLAALPENRMVALIKTMKQVPVNMMFSLGPRLSQPGFRWAPRSILRAKGGGVLAVVSSVVPHSDEDLENRTRFERFPSKLDRTGRGLLTFIPAVSIRKVYSGENSWIFWCKEKIHSCRLIDDESSEEDIDSENTKAVFKKLTDGQRLALLVPEFNPGARFKCGVLVEVFSEAQPFHQSKSSKDGDTARAKFLHMVAVAQLTREELRIQMANSEINETDFWRNNEEEWLHPRFWLVD